MLDVDYRPIEGMLNPDASSQRPLQHIVGIHWPLSQGNRERKKTIKNESKRATAREGRTEREVFTDVACCQYINLAVSCSAPPIPLPYSTGQGRLLCNRESMLCFCASLNAFVCLCLCLWIWLQMFGSEKWLVVLSCKLKKLFVNRYWVVIIARQGWTALAALGIFLLLFNFLFMLRMRVCNWKNQARIVSSVFSSFHLARAV